VTATSVRLLRSSLSRHFYPFPLCCMRRKLVFDTDLGSVHGILTARGTGHSSFGSHIWVPLSSRNKAFVVRCVADRCVLVLASGP